jgi:hypothetical protein
VIYPKPKRKTRRLLRTGWTKHGCGNHKPYLTRADALREVDAHRILYAPRCEKCQSRVLLDAFPHKGHWHIGHKSLELLAQEGNTWSSRSA